jgi:sulfate permease, SulP family
MSEWENFVAVLKGPKSDVAVMVITFGLTVLVDLTVAIEIGMIVAAFLFLRKMIKSADVNIMQGGEGAVSAGFHMPKGVEVFELSGPFFFGAVYKFKDAIKSIEKMPKVFIIRMGKVPIIDATGIRTLKEVQHEFSHKGCRLILSEVTHEQVLRELQSARLLFAIGKANVVDTFEKAIIRARQLLESRPLVG